ncbi:SMP-30/gluconolactonase/LRE family protein [Rhizobium alvei]|uniref:SMP-30/gluconolactonase/LRE family protein n=1 Tax=Rhizobium alvei TaxID=1132659 RepID=A0ABT8YG31_9HYPH|nr:SMP-30/gluconolactonase/LRE family protein [Rhizobium alvei]MDO6962623.1 SMP-30/gluconolactonase/LRE family protein [Rhizobium alvei]
MVELTGYNGRILDQTSLYHGEGPTYDPITDTAWWFSIFDCQLHELNLSTGRKVVHTLPFMASVLARIDDARQLIVSEHGLHVRDVATGALELVTPIEQDKPHMRSNDGRCHPSGALWFGTMTKHGEGRKGAGAIYHVLQGKVTLLYPEISIPNGICFSPDGSTGYFVDTMDNLYKKVTLDPATGLPTGEPTLFSDESGEAGGVDGSVCAADGSIFNARWGVGEIQHYAPDGRKIARYKLPPKQTTCPAFIGKEANRLLVTTARENLSLEEWQADPEAGYTYSLDIGIKGVFDAAYRL